jgi:hypothetical protein
MKTFTKMIHELYVAPINEAKQQFTSANTPISKNKLPKKYGSNHTRNKGLNENIQATRQRI